MHESFCNEGHTFTAGQFHIMIFSIGLHSLSFREVIHHIRRKREKSHCLQLATWMRDGLDEVREKVNVNMSLPFE